MYHSTPKYQLILTTHGSAGTDWGAGFPFTIIGMQDNYELRTSYIVRFGDGPHLHEFDESRAREACSKQRSGYDEAAPSTPHRLAEYRTSLQNENIEAKSALRHRGANRGERS